jgi:hypothetical protein
VSKHGKDFGEDLKFVDDFGKVVNLMNYQDSQLTRSFRKTLVKGAGII